MTRPVGRSLSRTWWSAAAGLLALAGCAGGNSPSSSGTSGGVTGGDFHSLVADPSTAGRIYVGGHTNVSRSDDNGKTWMAVAALDGADAMGWTIEPGRIWVSGHPGLNLSIDGGIATVDLSAEFYIKVQANTDDILQALNAPYAIAHHNLLISASAGIAWWIGLRALSGYAT